MTNNLLNNKQRNIYDDLTFQRVHCNFPCIIEGLSAGLRFDIFVKRLKKHLVRTILSSKVIQFYWQVGVCFMVSNAYIKN